MDAPRHLGGQADRLPPTHRLRTGRTRHPFSTIPERSEEDAEHDAAVEALVRGLHRHAPAHTLRIAEYAEERARRITDNQRADEQFADGLLPPDDVA
ncbi:hypothetical protein [Pseudonocardia xishanensis]|uniref:Uncharacterized protein n=1 Tax=Pseudonocardia xishanensis TaxID=630995 RepID=A0ABP8RZV2_9PSEU